MSSILVAMTLLAQNSQNSLRGEGRAVNGDQVSVAEAGGRVDGHLTAVTYQRARIELTPQLSVQPGLSINRIKLPGAAVTLKLVTSRVTYTAGSRSDRAFSEEFCWPWDPKRDPDPRGSPQAHCR